MSSDLQPPDPALPGAITTVAALPRVAEPPQARPLTPAATATRALARAQTLAGELVPRAHYAIVRLGTAGQVGLAALLAALVFAASTLLPARQGLETLSAALLRARHASSVVSVDQALPHLVASLPTRGQVPAVIGVMVTQAKASGVSLDVGHYSFSPAKSGSLARYDIEFPVKASYPDIRNFIDRTLAAVPAATLGKLRLERKGIGDGVVSADIGFVVFVHGGAQP